MEKLSGPVRALAVVAMAAAALGGCSNGDSGTPAPDKAEHASPTPATGGAARLTLRSAGGLGKILADGKGHTLYLFQADTSAKSTCDGTCAGVWPPLTTQGAPQAGPGVDASKLSTTTRDDGKKQVVHDGHPLYSYQGDDAAGDTNGQDLDPFGAKWFVLDASGRAIEKNRTG
ncbi:COG4315 family predicted lipoprotein [Streptomyces sp. CO7]